MAQTTELPLVALDLLKYKPGGADKSAAIAKVYQMLKPGGLFVTSTLCLGDKMAWFKLIAPMGKVLGFFPLVIGV